MRSPPLSPHPPSTPPPPSSHLPCYPLPPPSLPIPPTPFLTHYNPPISTPPTSRSAAALCALPAKAASPCYLHPVGFCNSLLLPPPSPCHLWLPPCLVFSMAAAPRGLMARRGPYLNDQQTETIHTFGAQCATQIMSLQTAVGNFFQWLLSQNLTGEQFYAAHQTFKEGVSSTNAVPKKKVNAIMNAIAEVIESPVWQWNSDRSSRHKKAQIAFHAMLHQNHELVPAFPCTKCSHVVGIVVRCSGYPNPCENHFHVGCAASFVEQSSTRFKRYYCDSCTSSIHQRQFKQKKKQAKPVLSKAAGKQKSQQPRNRSKDSATKDSVSVPSVRAASVIARMASLLCCLRVQSG